jgi:hypothetical protein
MTIVILLPDADRHTTAMTVMTRTAAPHQITVLMDSVRERDLWNVMMKTHVPWTVAWLKEDAPTKTTPLYAVTPMCARKGTFAPEESAHRAQS